MAVPTWLNTRLIDAEIEKQQKQREINSLPKRVKHLEKRIAKLEKQLTTKADNQ